MGLDNLEEMHPEFTSFWSSLEPKREVVKVQTVLSTLEPRKDVVLEVRMYLC